MQENVILSVKNITKTYPGVVALKDCSLDIKRGEVHAIVGENGAGKSTLIKVIAGAISPDQGHGRLIVNNNEFHSLSPLVSRNLGIEVIYQEFNLAKDLSVMENMFLGFFPGKKYIVNYKEMERKTREIFQLMKINIDPHAIVGDLSVGYMQLVEIAKAISRDAKIIIMDEPTAPLTTNEISLLFDLIKRLKEKEITIIYISHRLNEIFEISDRVTIMRDGEIVTTDDTSNMTREMLVKLMVGRTFSETFPLRTRKKGEELLRVEGLETSKVKDISFSIHKNEIFCLAGLVGAGRTETLRAIFGADKIEHGEIFLKGKKVHIHSPRDAVRFGIGMVPEDRMNQGVALELSIKHNIILAIVNKISRFMFVNTKKEKTILDNQQNALKIKADSLNALVKNLSGGNQQKVVVAKWLARESEILLMDEPTRGIDVGAKQEIYKLMNSLAEQGFAIIMVSSDMEEVMGMADRILILSEGRPMGAVEFGTEEFNQVHILNLASGHN